MYGHEARLSATYPLMDDIRRVHQFRLDLQGVPFAIDAQEGATHGVLKVGDGSKRISCRVTIPEFVRLSDACARMAAIDGEKSPYQHATLKGSGRFTLETDQLSIEIEPASGSSQVCFRANSRSSEDFYLNGATGEHFSEMALFFGDVAKALSGEASPLEESDDALGPRSRPSSLADAD